MRCSGSGCVRLGGGTSARRSVAAAMPLMDVGCPASSVLSITVPASLTDDPVSFAEFEVLAARGPAMRRVHQRGPTRLTVGKPSV